MILSSIFSCNSKKKSVKMTQTVLNDNKTIGIVSHKYHNDGCSSVIIIYKENKEYKTLIPNSKLDSLIDIDGLIIKFNYHLSKRMQQKKCPVGIPAIISEIEKNE